MHPRGAGVGVTGLFDEAVRAVYAAATDPDLWPEALDAIARCTGDVGTVLMWKRDDGSFGTIVSPALEAAQAAYVADWWQQDIRAFRGVERGYLELIDGATDRTVVSDEEMRSHPIYTDFLIPHGLGWFAAASASPDPSLYAVISVQRCHTNPPYSDDEVRLVAMLARHVEQSLRLSMRLVDAEVTRGGLIEALSKMTIGVFGLDFSGRLTLSNEAAQALLGRELLVQDDRLVPKSVGERAEFARIIRTLLDDPTAEPPKPRILHSTSGGEPVVIRFLPTAGAARGSDLLARTTLLVLALEVGRHEPIDPTIIRDLMGLTLAEARVAALIGSGLSPRLAAGRLGITEETTRTVLKRVFAKTGISRQSELVALLVGLALR